MQTLKNPKGAEDESRRSSTCQPGRVSIKYSDILLVEPSFSFANKFPVVDEVEFLTTVVGSEIKGVTETESLLIQGFCVFGSVIESEPLLKTAEGDMSNAKAEETLIPVKRNLLCFWVCSLAV